MKKQEKINILQAGVSGKGMCRCYFCYDPGFFYCYPNEVNDTFLLAQEEDDFILDGYFIRKITHLKKVEMRLDLCHEINECFGITEQIAHPGVDISSWKSIFESLMKKDTYVIIEDCIGGKIAIGVIEKVLKSKLYFKRFNAKGIWDEKIMEIPYSSITGVEWGTRYDVMWKKYLEQG